MLAMIARAGKGGRVLGPELDRVRVAGAAATLRRARASLGGEAHRLSDTHDGTYAQIWASAAAELGAEIEKMPEGFLLIRRGEASTVVYRQLVMLDHPASTALALNKLAGHGLLSAAGLAVPEHRVLGRESWKLALEFMETDRARAGGSFVVKPAVGTSGGEGVVCNVSDPDDLLRAWLAAGRWDRRVLLERQVPGEEYRLLMLDGELLGAVHRRRASVEGDGRSSVEELIEAENRRRLASGGDEVARLVRHDLDCELALKAQGLSGRSVVEAGRRVVLKGTVSQNSVRDNSTVAKVSPDLVAEAAKAAAALRLRLAGVDVLTTDVTTSLAESGGVIIEVNGTPGFHYHYQVDNPRERDEVAVPILERLLEESPGRGQAFL